MRREERVTVQGPVKEQQPDGMSHRGQAGDRGSSSLLISKSCWCRFTVHMEVATPTTARVAIGRWWQETNDLSPVRTTRQTFVDFGDVLSTVEQFKALAGQQAGELSGFMDELQTWAGGCEIVPLIGLTAFSSGRMTAAAHAHMR